MMKEKEKKVNATIRMPESSLIAIDEIAERTKQDRSEVLRVAVKRFLQTNNSIMEGKALTMLPKLNGLSSYQKVLSEVEKFVKEDVSEETKLIMSAVIDSLEWKILDELQKKHPNHIGFFDISSSEEDI